MQDVPKIVLKRLRSPAPGPHPDPDLLTAFAEQSLAGRERDSVLQHLARCGDCREAVSLALPPHVDLPRLAAQAEHWFQWPVLRWAAVAAGVALIASIGTMQYRRQHSIELASNIARSKEASATRLQGSQPSRPEAIPQSGTQDEKSAASRSQTVLPESKPPSPDNQALSETAKQNVTPSGIRRPASAPAPSSVEVSGAAPQNGALTAAENQFHGTLVQNEPAEQLQPSVDRVGKAKAVVAQGAPASMTVAPAPGADAGLTKGTTLRWTISATGALQRSLDGGQTWQDVTLALSGSIAGPLMRSKSEMKSAAVADAQTESRPEANKDTKSAAGSAPSANKKFSYWPAASSAGMVFRALSISPDAAEVWAGGSSGLYHTIDGGNVWVRVVPSDGGVAFTGDIVSIQFADPRTGTVTTSTGEIWSTSDAGQSWHKQQ